MIWLEWTHYYMHWLDSFLMHTLCFKWTHAAHRLFFFVKLKHFFVNMELCLFGLLRPKFELQCCNRSGCVIILMKGWNWGKIYNVFLYSHHNYICHTHNETSRFICPTIWLCVKLQYSAQPPQGILIVASTPGFLFQILSHSFGEKTLRQNLDWKAWVWGYPNCASLHCNFPPRRCSCIISGVCM